MKRLTFIGDIDVSTGYGQHSIQLIRGLQKIAGIHLAVRPVEISREFGEIPTDIAERIVSCVQPERWEILLNPPGFGPTPGKKTAYFTMHESTRISNSAKAFLNQASVVIVPTKINAAIFSACGVDAPIRIVPLGVDPAIYSYRDHPDAIKDLCVFGVAGRQSSGQARKGISNAIEAFLSALPIEDDARLKVKVFPGDHVPQVDDPRVEIVRSYLPDDKMADWLAGIHCFLSASKSEGWGLIQHQAMAIGRPVIGVPYGGVIEHFDALECWYPVRFKLELSTDVWKGFGYWAVPDRDSMIQQIRSVYANRRKAIERGCLCANRVQHLTWDESNNALIDVLEEFGAVEFGSHRRRKVSNFNYGVIAYLPPRGIGNTEAFLKNLKEHPPAAPIVFLSDGDWPDSVRIPSPTQWFKDTNQIASYVFLKALEEAEAMGWDRFIYLETDCRVRGDGWDCTLSEKIKPADQIAAGHMAICNPETFSDYWDRISFSISKQNPFDEEPGVVLQQGHPLRRDCVFVNGAPAIYSVSELRKLFPPQPTHVAAKLYTCQDRDLGDFAINQYGALEAFKKFEHVPEILATAGETIHLFNTRIQSLNNGVVKAVHPIKNRWRPSPPGGYSFYHSGDLGDIIYSLKAISLMGGGSLQLGPECGFPYPPRKAMDRPTFDLFAEFLRQQAYLTSVKFSGHQPHVSHDFNEFRMFWNERQQRKIPIDNLCEMHCYSVGIDPLFESDPWLVSESKRIEPYVIHRSFRYKDNFPWKRVLQKIGKQAVFIGLPEEHKAFTEQCGTLPFYMVRDFGEMAAIINGADWFIGNQSLPCALAIGLGVNVFQETWTESPDCVFKRLNFFNQQNRLEGLWT